MFLTEQEILATPQALMRVCDYFKEHKSEIDSFFEKNKQRKLVFFGCGSSYMLAKSGEAVFRAILDTQAIAIPAGDYIVNPSYWKNIVTDSIVVTLSRSGRTSEIVRAVKHIKQNYGCPVISLSMENDNDIMPMSDLDLTFDWCYDKSVCQTRTVACLYAAQLLLASEYSKNEALSAAVKATAEKNERFQAKNRPLLEKIAEMEWENVVVLADGEVCGIAEEGALAFTEIAMLPGRYSHLLDYRHGPIVISDEKTLTLILVSDGDEELQGAIVRELIARKGAVVTAGSKKGNPYGASAHIEIDEISEFAAWGIPFVYISQIIALLKATQLGGNPDSPKGLDAYIKL